MYTLVVHVATLHIPGLLSSEIYTEITHPLSLNKVSV